MRFRNMIACASVSAAMAGSAFAGAGQWTGFYLGLQGGYADHNGTQLEIDDPALTVNDSFEQAVSGAFGGAHVGYNHQMGAWVLGVEGDLEVSDVSGFVNTDPNFSYEDFNWLGSLRVRAGYTDGAILIYATGGLAVSDVDMLVTEDTPVTDFIAASDTAWGYTLGGGVEFAFSPKWSGRIEYRWTDLDDTIVAGNIYGGDFIYTNENDFSAVRIGVSYHLN